MSENFGNNIDFVIKQNQKYNIIKNTFQDFIEIVYFKSDKNITHIDYFNEFGEKVDKIVDRSRKFILSDDGVLNPVSNAVSILKLQSSLKNSRKRALDNLFGFALSNTWSYFVTLTFSPSCVDREDDQDIIYHWSLFRQKLQYYFENVKVLAIPERHPRSGALHIHALVGNCDLTDFCSRAINPKTNKQIYSNGRVVYNLNMFDFGFSTLVKIDSNPLKVANYLTKYVIKDFGNIGYNKKHFFHTRNLCFKNKELLYFNNNQFFEFSQTYADLLELYKENDDIIVYRYKLPFQD